MADNSTDVKVTDNVAERRFEARLDGEVAFLTYARRRGSLFLLHTEVPPGLEGRGIGSKLAVAALDDARKNGLAVVPRCAFVADYIERHPEYADLVRGRSSGGSA